VWYTLEKYGICKIALVLLADKIYIDKMKSESDVIHTEPFGRVPKKLLNTVTIESCRSLFGEIMNITLAAPPEKRQTLQNDENYLQKLDAFRHNVGALYLTLSQRLDNDILKAHGVTSNFGKCMIVSLFFRSLQPQKYYNLCGTQLQGYGALVTQLANLPSGQQLILDRWNSNTTKQFVDGVWRTNDRLMEKEKEYRNTTVAIAQIGIGVGGMLLGLIGLLLSVAMSYIASPSSDQKPEYRGSPTQQSIQKELSSSNQSVVSKSEANPKGNVK
jgi:hypothetical protein